MKRIFVFTVLLVVLAGGGFLSTRTIAPQSHMVEKALPSDKFIK